jgi:predicted RNase H-like HicB family nuclease
MKHYFTTIITQENKWFIAKCAELGVVSQGETIEEAQDNLKEAVGLYLDDNTDSKELLLQRAPLITSLEIEYA